MSAGRQSIRAARTSALRDQSSTRYTSITMLATACTYNTLDPDLHRVRYRTVCLCALDLSFRQPTALSDCERNKPPLTCAFTQHHCSKHTMQRRRRSDIIPLGPPHGGRMWYFFGGAAGANDDGPLESFGVHKGGECQIRQRQVQCQQACRIAGFVRTDIRQRQICSIR